MKNRAFKGIWIPKEIWLSTDLKVMEKLVLVEIDSLDNEEGCFASNDHFSKFFSCHGGILLYMVLEIHPAAEQLLYESKKNSRDVSGRHRYSEITSSATGMPSFS